MSRGIWSITARTNRTSFTGHLFGGYEISSRSKLCCVFSMSLQPKRYQFVLGPSSLTTRSESCLCNLSVMSGPEGVSAPHTRPLQKSGIASAFLVSLCETTARYRYWSVREELGPRKWVGIHIFSINSTVALTLLYCVLSCIPFWICSWEMQQKGEKSFM